jgi:hypothetical protein
VFWSQKEVKILLIASGLPESLLVCLVGYIRPGHPEEVKEAKQGSSHKPALRLSRSWFLFMKIMGKMRKLNLMTSKVTSIFEIL